jgi:hypothetical protein
MGRSAARLARLCGRVAWDAISLCLWAVFFFVGVSVVVVFGIACGIMWAVEHTLVRLHA